MNSEEQSQDFEKLQHLLKLKRYEQPPPRYFNSFSSQVLAYIRADKSVTRLQTADDFISRTPWLRRLWRKLENQPALSGAIATIACGLMVAGVFLMEETKPQNMTFNPAGETGGAGSLAAQSPLLGNNNLAAAAMPLAGSTSTNSLQTGPNLFQNLPTLQTFPVSGAPLLQK